MKKIDLQNTFWTKIKGILLVMLITALISGGAFIGGTFYPNWIAIDKLKETFHKSELDKVMLLGLQQPEFEFTDKASFIVATGKCVDYLNFTTDRYGRVPTSIIIAMAGIESGWGTSRFASEGNALFGVRTWDLENVAHMKAKENPDADWGVKKYKTKCDSVKDMIEIINRHPAYEAFRIEREKQLDNGKWNYKILLSNITAWSTNPDYSKIILQAIVDNKLP